MLQLIDVRKSYREPDGHMLPILCIDAYRLDEGEQAVLVGKSGGGKTTLLHVISGSADRIQARLSSMGSILRRCRKLAVIVFGPTRLDIFFKPLT